MDTTKERLKNLIIKEKAKVEARNIKKVETKPIIDKPTPWYRKPLSKYDFIYTKAKNDRWYIRHREWSKRTYVGPYKEIEDCDAIVDCYVAASLKGGLMGTDLLKNGIHSVIIDNPNEFFQI